jgi:septal ring factor EnvC (AmiA/AmiB activator)
MKLTDILSNIVLEAIIDDQTIKDKIANFYELQKKIKEMESNLKEIKSQFGEFEELITPIIDGLKEVKDRTAETEEYIVEISRFGGEQTNVSYKDAFENALTKVNGATRKVLDEALEASKKTTKVKHSFSIRKIDVSESNILTNITNFINRAVSKFVSIFKTQSKIIDSANRDLKKLSKQK